MWGNLGSPYNWGQGAQQVWKTQSENASKRKQDGTIGRKSDGNHLWNNKDGWLVKYLSREVAINADRYCQIFTKLRFALEHFKREVVRSSTILSRFETERLVVSSSEENLGRHRQWWRVVLSGAPWYTEGIKKLLHRYQKCTGRNDEYVEK